MRHFGGSAMWALIFCSSIAAGAAELSPLAALPGGGLYSSPPVILITNRGSPGVIFYTLDGSDPRTPNGAVSTRARSYSDPILLDRSCVLTARSKVNDGWSAPMAAAFTLQPDFSKLLFTEVMFHPRDSDRGEAEFVEFKNTGEVPLDLNGLSLFGMIISNSPPLAAGGVRVFSGPWPNLYRLSNTGQEALLRTPSGGVAARMRYDTHAPWQVVPDNHGYYFDEFGREEIGFSLVRTNFDSSVDPGHHSTWVASAVRGGSPGEDDPGNRVPGIYINEVLARSGTGQPDAVELHNPNAEAVEVGGWWLSDARNWPYKYKFPAGTVVGPGGYLVVPQSQFGQGTNGFSFSAEGDRCYLFSATAAGELTGFSHGFEFGASEPDVSFGRIVGRDGSESFAPQQRVTLGMANAGPIRGSVVISEINYHPSYGDAEFIELANTTDAAVPLWDPGFPAATWALGRSGASETTVLHRFAQNVVIPARGLVLLVNGDAAAFRQRHAVPAAVNIFPVAFRLGNGGERIQLLKPSGRSNGTVRDTVVDDVTYDDKFPWPSAADGGGHSLERAPLESYGADPAHWRANPSGISPGRNTSTNHPPSAVVAGQTIAFVNRPITLTGFVHDDGFPSKPINSSWSVTGGTLIKQGAGLTNAVALMFEETGAAIAEFSYTDGEFTGVKRVSLNVTARPYDVWTRASFPSNFWANPAVVGEQADPDADGLTNLEEYIFNCHPNQATGSPIHVSVRPEAVEIHWFELISAPDVEVIPQFAHRAEGPWFWGEGLFARSEIKDPSSRMKMMKLRLANDNPAAGAGRFFRLLISPQ